MRVIWSPQAQEDRDRIFLDIAAHNPRAALDMDATFDETAYRLAEHPYLGHTGAIPETREILPHRSYRMAYRIVDDAIWIVTVIHTARHWPPE